jgi:RimK family alpha-L-glutamate ligase
MRIFILGIPRDSRVALLSRYLNAPILDPFVVDATDINADGIVAYLHIMPLLLLYENKNIPVANPVKVIELYGDKYLVYESFKNDLPVLQRRLLLLPRFHENGDYERVREFWIRFLQGFKFPIVIKATRGSLGTTVMKINDLQSALSVLEVLARYSDLRSLCVEEFVPHEFDVRVFATWDGKVWMMRRIRRSPDFRANVAKGAATEAFYDPELEDKAKRIMEVTGAAFLGIDFIPSNDGFLLNEINTKPGFEGLMKIAGENFLKELADSIKAWLKR